MSAVGRRRFSKFEGAEGEGDRTMRLMRPDVKLKSGPEGYSKLEMGRRMGSRPVLGLLDGMVSATL